LSEITAVPLRPVGRGGVIALWVGIALLLAVGIGAAVAASRAPMALAMPPAEFMAANAKKRGVQTTASGLEYQVLKKGKGPTPVLGDIAQFEYAGTLVDGTKFDATPKGQAATFQIGQLVPGFNEALTMMPRGARYRVWIPPQLGYGERESGPIPANSVLVFDITLRDFASLPQGGQPISIPPG